MNRPRKKKDNDAVVVPPEDAEDESEEEDDQVLNYRRADSDTDYIIQELAPENDETELNFEN